jgi:hypothetical protein
MGRRRGRARPVRQARWRRAGRPRFGRRRDGVEGRRGGGGGLLAIILVLAIGFGVWYFLIRDDDASDVTPTVSPTPTVSVTASPEGET